MSAISNLKVDIFQLRQVLFFLAKDQFCSFGNWFYFYLVPQPKLVLLVKDNCILQFMQYMLAFKWQLTWCGDVSTPVFKSQRITFCARQENNILAEPAFYGYSQLLISGWESLSLQHTTTTAYLVCSKAPN